MLSLPLVVGGTRLDLVGSNGNEWDAMAGSTDAVVVSSIRPGSPASRHVGLVPGLLLERVQVRACCLDPRLVSQAYLSFF